MSTLYELSDGVAQLRDFLDNTGVADPDSDPADISEAESLEIEARSLIDKFLTELIPVKVEGYCRLVRNLEAQADACEDEEKRLRTRRQAATNKIRFLKERLLIAFRAADLTKVSAGTFVVSIQKNPPAVEVDSIEALAGDYLVVRPPEPNKIAIKIALQSGRSSEVPGCRLVQGESVRIR